MKIAILTQPLGKNYGGILQAYALQQVLTLLGHESIVVDRQDNYPSYKLLIWRIASVFKCIINKYIRQDRNTLILNPVSINYITDKRQVYDYSELNRFVNHNIKKSKIIRTSSLLRQYLLKNNIDCVVVGSDQVWREEYSPCITDYFGGFLRYNDRVKIISYAASFGLERIPIVQEMQLRCRELLTNFCAISVREKSALEILRSKWGLNAKLVLDPTLLHDSHFYENLFIEHVAADIDIFGYLLDNTSEKKQMLEIVSNSLKMNVTQILLYPSDDQGNAGKLSSMIDWLYNISKAKFVVTDSYHGCVFSIIFKKPFIVIANQKRGIDRFISLLEPLGLMNRLIYSTTQISDMLLAEEINYKEVERALQQQRQQSLDFLKHVLSSDGVNYCTGL